MRQHTQQRRGFAPVRGDAERGAATVEFAIIFTLLIALLFGIIEFGILIYDNHVLTNASREGARAGLVMRTPRLSDNEIQTIIRNYAEEYMVTFGPTSTLIFESSPPWITPSQSSRTGLLFGTELKINVKYSYRFLILSGFGLGPITLEAETRMKME